MGKLDPADKAILMAGFARMDIAALAAAIASVGAVAVPADRRPAAEGGIARQAHLAATWYAA